MPPAVPLEDKVNALGGAVDRVTRRVGTHDDQIKDLAGHVADLFTRITAPAQGGSKDAPRLCWLTVSDPADAYTALVELVEWLAAVYLRYPDTSLPACWLWHPWAVEELLVLKAAHDAAYGPRSAVKDALDFHDKHVRNVAERIEKYLGTHTLELHTDGPMPPPPVPCADPTTVSRVVPEWVFRREVPAPTGVEQAEAVAYDVQRQRMRSDRNYQV
jgi:hypothetical protein